MLLFRSEEGIGHWSKKHQMPLGQILTLEQVWDLSLAWYSDRLSSNYTGRPAKQLEEIFKNVGLGGSFWRLVLP